jgi:hypothetical protein
MGHAMVSTTLGFYAHLFDDYHSTATTALGAYPLRRAEAGNVICLQLDWAPC